jgi:hypothetical protein
MQNHAVDHAKHSINVTGIKFGGGFNFPKKTSNYDYLRVSSISESSLAFERMR